MTITVNSSDCHSVFNSTTQLVVNLSVYGATTSIGAISSLAAVVIILVAKGYKEFVYRLLLYMAVDNLLGFPIYLAYKFEVNYNVLHDLTIPTSFFSVISFVSTHSFCVGLVYTCSYWLSLESKSRRLNMRPFSTLVTAFLQSIISTAPVKRHERSIAERNEILVSQ